MDANHRIDIYGSALLAIGTSSVGIIKKFDILSVILVCVSIIAATYSIVAAHYTTKERKLSIRKMEKELFDSAKKEKASQ